MIKRAALFILALVSIPATALAQTTDAANKAQTANEDAAKVLTDALAFPGLSAPDNLAAGALSIGADDVKPITDIGGLGSSLLTGIGPDGKLKGAFGISFTPFSLGAAIDVDRYEKDAWSRVVARTNFSVAVSQAETSEGNGSIAIGAQTVLFSRGDILTREADGKPALRQCAANTLVGVMDRPGPPPANGDAETDGDVPDSIFGPYSACVAALNKATWNDSSFGIGLVEVARAKGNQVTNLEQSNTVAYLSFTYGFEGLDHSDEVHVKGKTITSECGSGFHWSCNAQIVVKLKYESAAAYDLPNIGATSAETTGTGVKFLVGNERTVSYGYYRQDEAKFSFGKRRLHEWGLGVQTKLGEKTWINLVAGRKDDDIHGNEDTVKVTLSWDITKVAALANPFAR